MTPRRVAVLYGAGLCALIGGLALPQRASGVESDLERVLAHLRRQQDATKVVHFRVEGKRVVAKGRESESFGPAKPGDKSPRPPQDTVTELKHDFLFDFPGRRFRRIYQDVIDDKPGTWIQVFDGKKSYGSKIDVPIEQAEGLRPEKMSIIAGGDKVQLFNSWYWPYFLSQGFILTRMDHAFYWHDFRPTIDAENVFVHRHDTLRGRACYVLQPFPVGPKQSAHLYEYVIDREDGSVRRMTHWIGGKKKLEIVIDYHRADDRVIPTRWTNEWFEPEGGKLWRSETMTVLAADQYLTADDSRFGLTAQAGAIVKEYQFPNGQTNLLKNKVEKSSTYQADESGRLIEGELVDGKFRPRRRWLWWLVSGVAAVALLVGMMAYRRVRSRKVPTAAAGAPSEGGTP